MKKKNWFLGRRRSDILAKNGSLETGKKMARSAGGCPDGLIPGLYRLRTVRGAQKCRKGWNQPCLSKDQEIHDLFGNKFRRLGKKIRKIIGGSDLYSVNFWPAQNQPRWPTEDEWSWFWWENMPMLIMVSPFGRMKTPRINPNFPTPNIKNFSRGIQSQFWRILIQKIFSTDLLARVE